MGPRQRYANAIGWMADHIAVVLFVSALAGGLFTAFTTSESVLRAYAPLSYVVAGLIGAILTVGFLWSVWAFARWVHHGSGIRDALKEEAESVPISVVQPSALGFDPPDITEAKNRLCDFALKVQSPTSSALNRCLIYGGIVLKNGFKDNIFIDLASDGFEKYSPTVPPFNDFADIQLRRSKTLKDFEFMLLPHIRSYVAAYLALHRVLVVLDNKEIPHYTSNFRERVTYWFGLHNNLLRELDRISSDSRYPRLAQYMETNPFTGSGSYTKVDYNPAVIAAFAALQVQLGS